MLNTLLLTLGAISTAPAPAPVSLPAATVVLTQDDPKDLPDKRDEVKELVGTMKDHVKQRGKEDVEAIVVIDKLLGEFEKSGLKDRALIAKEVGSCLKENRKEIDGVLDNKLFLAAGTALGDMGPESVKILTSWIGHKSHKKDLDLQATLIRSLGKTKDEKGVKPLLDLLSHHEALIQAAAAEALGNFVHLKEKERKVIFEDILQILTGVYNTWQADSQDIIARERYDVIAASMVTTLQVLSGHDERQPPEWRRWWNKNKNENWDKDE
ncbi:MAG: HEAT repeat domain-containing protein [Planctomycetota bacterium]|nr:HEAT repeat domain-containing protein [Planctomycetota bacterium]